MELLNPRPRRKDWLEFLPGRWRLLYCTGRHIGLTLRQPSLRALIGSACLTFTPSSDSDTPAFSLSSDVSFVVVPSSDWPHDKSGTLGNLNVKSTVGVAPGRRLYLREDSNEPRPFSPQESNVWKVSSKKLKEIGAREPPFGLRAAKLVAGEVDIEMSLDPMPSSPEEAGSALREVRTQIPPEMFDVAKLVCGTYIDARLMVLRGVNGSALLFTRSCSLS